MKTAKEIIQLALLVALVSLVVVCAVTVWRVQRATLATLADVQGTADEIRRVASESKQLINESRRVVQYQRAEFEDGQYQKRLRDTIVLTNQLIGQMSSSTLPAVYQSLTAWGHAGQEVALLLRHTDASLNEQLFPEVQRAVGEHSAASAKLVQELTATARTLNASVAQTAAAVEKLVQAGVVDLGELQKLLADPRWQEALQQVAAGTTSLAGAAQNVEAITANGAAAAKQLPDIARDVQAFTHQQSKYGKLVILARILRALTF